MTNEGLIRLSIFAAVLIIIILWEVVAPRRVLTTGRRSRWFANLSLIFISNLLVRLTFPLLPVAFAAVVQSRGWGLINNYPRQDWLNILLAVLFLDLIIYLQHVLFHFLPILWRLHRMHHCDLDLDATSGNRFHPLEIMISIVIKLAAITLIGASPAAVLIFEIVLNASATFNHGNILIPVNLDRWLRLLLVTPDMHRVHHSVIVSETNSNFGFCLPWWDRLLGTYRSQPAAGHQGMVIGLKEYRDPQLLTLPHLLIQPFKKRQR